MITIVTVWCVGTAITSSAAGVWWLIVGRKRDQPRHPEKSGIEFPSRPIR